MPIREMQNDLIDKLTGNPIEEHLWESMDRYVALTALHLHVHQKDTPRLWVEKWLDMWEEAVREGQQEKMDDLEEMSDSPAGKLLGVLMPDSDELEEGLDEAIASIRTHVRKALLQDLN